MKRHILKSTILALLGIAVFVGCQSMYGQVEGLDSGKTASFFEAIQIDPRSEDSAGPQFIATGDFNNDGRIDIATAWNESQPVQIHIQQRTNDGEMFFITLPIAGTTPIAVVSDLAVEDMDQDGFDDIVVLVKDTGLCARCDPSCSTCDTTNNGGCIDGALDGTIYIFFNPQDIFNNTWLDIELIQAHLPGIDVGELPEEGGYAAMDIGDVDEVNGPDIVVTFNSTCTLTCEDCCPDPNLVDFYPNPGPSHARTREAWNRKSIHSDAPHVSDCRIADIDRDGDLDVIVTYPEARSDNIRWLPNPLIPGPLPQAKADEQITYEPTGNEYGTIYNRWPTFAPIGQIATGANTIDIGNIDNDADANGNPILDVIVRSRTGQIVQWFKGPEFPSLTFIRNPWEVYTAAEFTSREPGAIALGDLTGNGQLDLALSAQGAVAWFTPYTDGSIYNNWEETIIIDDRDTQETQTATTTLDPTDPNATAEVTSADTLINSIVIVDIDGDGYNDILATLDRTAMSGLTNDALALFRNTLGDED